MLKHGETLTISTPETPTRSDFITRAEVQTTYQDRVKHLEEIRSVVCLKFYNGIKGKLENEKRQFEQLLHWQDTRDEALSQYSLVLNPYYFEQKFLGVDI